MDLLASVIPTSPCIANDSSHDLAEEEQGTPAQNEFFKILLTMISNCTHPDCIEWLPDNRGFMITKKQIFLDNVLPKYFGKTKFTSFTRRLKRWGFNRTSNGMNAGAYYHERFSRQMQFDTHEFDDVGAVDTNDLGSASSINNTPTSALPLKKRVTQRVRNYDAFRSTVISRRSPEPSSFFDHHNYFLSQPHCREPSAYHASAPTPSSNKAVTCHTDDVHAMPKIMREINRTKRKETKNGEFDTPPNKKSKFWPASTRSNVHDEDYLSTVSNMHHSYPYYEDNAHTGIIGANNFSSTGLRWRNSQDRF